ncbi:MAG: hypothetical protein K1X78_05250 [Verrucomicrobiaceae bacterium]|nr:hypothetical protein [Verrucomicrobiaceae bacterium]
MTESLTKTNEKPHPALVWLWWLAAPVAVVTSVLREVESASAYRWQFWGSILFVVGSGILLRAKAFVRDTKDGPPDACEERNRFVMARFFKFGGCLALIGLVGAPLIGLGEALEGGQVDWLRLTREASGAGVAAVLSLNFARLQAIPITIKPSSGIASNALSTEQTTR